MTLDYEQNAGGGLTYRELHELIRLALELEPKVSMLEMPIPESSALPANDAQCTHLLGTTLWCWTYV